MELFERNTVNNLLPYDGIASYLGVVMDRARLQQYFDQLMAGVKWENDEAYIFGKHYVTKRKVAWYGDHDFDYTYSNATKKALPWTRELIAIRNMIEDVTAEPFNSCLLNLYHDGSEGMAWHSDGEKMLRKNGVIASLTLGAERRFSFRHKESGEIVSLVLENGSLLIMKGTCQTYWQHRLPPTKKVSEPRINLTFRQMEMG